MTDSSYRNLLTFVESRHLVNSGLFAKHDLNKVKSTYVISRLFEETGIFAESNFASANWFRRRQGIEGESAVRLPWDGAFAHAIAEFARLRTH
jgi:hypothetical protein